MSKCFASLSLDLDNKWSYLKTHGDPGWQSFPSYLNVVVPRILRILDERELKITFFVVGQDAEIEDNRAALKSLATAGHEIGNHSFHHEPWLHLYGDQQLETEFDRAEQAIVEATGQKPVGFRGPGFSLSDASLRLLHRRGYQYDCSTFPTFLGPVARAYFFVTARLDKEQRKQRKQLFGKLSDGLRTLRPHRWHSLELDLLEIPVTTMPIAKVPIHLSYILYLAQFSKAVAIGYFRTFLLLCRALRIEPSILLHPLDFMGCEDDRDLAFFPAMKMQREAKLAVATKVLDLLQARYNVGPMIEHARLAASRGV